MTGVQTCALPIYATASVVFFDISKKFKSILLQGSTTNISSTLTIVEDGYIRASSRNQNHASPGCLKIAIKGDNVDIVKNFNRISTQIADIEGTINTTKYKDIDAVLVEDNTYYSTEGEKTAYSGRIAYHYNTIDLFIKEATKGGVASYLALFYDQEDNIVGNTSITTSAYQYTDFDLQEYVIQNYSTVNVAKVIVSVNKEIGRAHV